MHIEKCKERGFILIEVLIILNILIVLIVVSSKQMVSNIIKSNYYDTKDDIRTLDDKEERLVQEVTSIINSDKELLHNLLDPIKSLDVTFIHYLSKYNDMWIEIKFGKIYIVSKFYDLRKYKELIFKTIVEEEEISGILIPTLYKSDFIK